MNPDDFVAAITERLKKEGDKIQLEMPWQSERHRANSMTCRQIAINCGFKAEWTSEPRGIQLPANTTKTKFATRLRRELTISFPPTPDWRE